MTEAVCGVDVCKAWLDAHIAPAGVVARFANTEAGIAQLAALCRENAVSLAVLEATNGCERAAWLGLWNAEIPTAQVNPFNVRRFAEGLGFLEKTDKIDALALAEFGRTKRDTLHVTRPSEGVVRRMETLSARLRQLVSDITINKQRLSSAPDAETRESIKTILDVLVRESKRIEGELASMIDDDPTWNRLDAACREVKGVATRTVIALLSEMPELGTVSDKKIAKLGGLAPFANDSGDRKGRRRVRGGRANIRRILFVVAGGARRFHPSLGASFDRMTKAGKPKRVIRIALARKLLVILNAKARDARREMTCTT